MLFSYGTDYYGMKIDDVSCSSSSYLSLIAQCSFSTYIDYGCTNFYDATVYCCKLNCI